MFDSNIWGCHCKLTSTLVRFSPNSAYYIFLNLAGASSPTHPPPPGSLLLLLLRRTLLVAIGDRPASPLSLDPTSSRSKRTDPRASAEKSAHPGGCAADGRWLVAAIGKSGEKSGDRPEFPHLHGEANGGEETGGQGHLREFLI